MSIFRRDSEPPAEPHQAVRPAKPQPKPAAKNKSAASESTHIANGSKVVGRISGSADLVIDGVVDGEIDLESQVVIGSEGRVEGKILARSVEVGGRVNGNVQGFERVEVLATGSLEGDVMSPRVVIAEGAFFKGKVEMTDQITRPGSQGKQSQGKQSQGDNQPQGGQSKGSQKHQGGQAQASHGNKQQGGQHQPGRQHQGHKGGQHKHGHKTAPVR